MSEAAEEIIQSYFSTYLDYPISRVKEGEIMAVASRRRTRPELGWGLTVACWIHIQGGKAVISVRPDFLHVVQKLITEVTVPEELLEEEWRKKVSAFLGTKDKGSLIHVFYCTHERLRTFRVSGCRRLEESNIEAYIKMKLHLYPDCDPESLAMNIQRNIRDGIAYGVFQEGKLVSVSEAPSIGHMQDSIEEIGVDTLPEYRRRGFGKAAASAMTKAVLDIGRIPIGRCSSKNEPSLRVTERVGYTKYADIVQFLL